MSTINTVAVTGATGFVGRHVVAELVRRGYSVRVLARDAGQASQALGSSRSVRIVEGNVLDRQSPARLVEGAQALVHLVGIIREQREPGRPAQTFQGVHVEATRAVLTAAADAGVRRCVHMSALGADPDGKAEYARTKWEGEQLVRRSGLDWTIFRPSLIHGPGSEFVEMVHAMARGSKAPFVAIPYFARFTDHAEDVWAPRMTLDAADIAPVYVQDVATLFCEALSRPQTVGEIYNAVGSQTLTWKSMMEAFRDALPRTDRNMPVVPVPSSHGAAIARAAGALGLGGLLPFDAGQAVMGGLDSTADLDKVRAHFGLQPARFDDALARYAAAPVHA
ncbi:MAG: NAD(P)H-binding protein [Phycisphaerales bacterium]|nr:NAD(P)H-binding protein [Phycisphaerales bacterium]